GLTCERGEGRPRVGRAGKPVAQPHREVVVRAEEAREAVTFGRLGERELIAVGRAELGFGEDAVLHGASLSAREHRIVHASGGWNQSVDLSTIWSVAGCGWSPRKTSG